MSTLTRCNYCTLKDMERKATERNAEVILEEDEDGWVTARYSDHWSPSAWFVRLTENCVC